MKVHCLFEQSGTFKNEFKKLGYEAYDYDILNDYGETDYQIDLYKEIRGGTKTSQASLINSQKTILFLLFFLAQDLNNKFYYGSEDNQNSN